MHRRTTLLPQHRPLQNRILPTGEIVANPARGLFTGNRGILSLENGRLGTSRWQHKHWIICTLTHPKGRYQGPSPTRGWTPLFFLDEAVALAAGHRPCGYCRPRAYALYKSIWNKVLGPANHNDIDTALHRARVDRSRQQIRHTAPLLSLPNGTFVTWQQTPHLLWDKQLYAFDPRGYGQPQPSPSVECQVLTPRPTLAVLKAGYTPVLHTTRLREH